MQFGIHSVISDPSVAAMTTPIGTFTDFCSERAKKNPIAEHLPAVADEDIFQEFGLSCHSKWFSVASMKRMFG